MKEKTPKHLRAMICKPGYYRRRMRYYRRLSVYYTAISERPNNLNFSTEIENAVRCHLKSMWYKSRIGTEPTTAHEPVFILELTKSRYDTAVRNYGPSVIGVFANIFKVEIPEEWK